MDVIALLLEQGATKFVISAGLVAEMERSLSQGAMEVFLEQRGDEVKTLRKMTKDIMFEDAQEQFCRAVEDGDEIEVRRCLELGVEPDRVETYLDDRRPLWCAAKYGHAGICEL